jgi:hypothetical protein
MSPDAGRMALGARVSWRKGVGAIDREGSPGLPGSTSDGQAIRSSHLTTIGFAKGRAQEAIESPPLLTSQKHAGSLSGQEKIILTFRILKTCADFGTWSPSAVTSWTTDHAGLRVGSKRGSTPHRGMHPRAGVRGLGQSRKAVLLIRYVRKTKTLCPIAKLSAFRNARWRLLPVEGAGCQRSEFRASFKIGWGCGVL